MKRIIYTCDRCGREISDDRFHITICKEIPAGEPELIENSADRDYCYLCMAEIAIYMNTAPSIVPAREQIAPENEEIAPEETIDLLEKPDTFPDPEDAEEPEESVLWELKEMDDAPKRSYSKRVNPETRDRIIELHKNGESIPLIAGRLGVERKLVTGVLYNARKKGLCE